jgi:hypothetical protein
MKELEASVKERETLHTLVSSLYDVQHIRIILSNRFKSRLHQYEYGGYVDDLLKVENTIKRDMKARAKKFPITEWIVAQRGLGYDLAAQLIGIIQDPGDYQTVSDLWAYFGLARQPWCFRCDRPYYPSNERIVRVKKLAQRLKDQNDKKIVKVRKDCQAEAERMFCSCESPVIQDVNQERHKGVIGNWNPHAKTLAYNIGVQFIRQGDHNTYRGWYDSQRAYYENRPDLKAEAERSKGRVTKGKDSQGKTIPVETKGTGHIHKMTQRWVEKLFLEHLWTVWMQLEGRSRPEPWVIAHGGHGHYIPAPPPYVKWKDGQSYFVYEPTPLPTESESEEVDSGSHEPSETQIPSASHSLGETRVIYASHLAHETQHEVASPGCSETQQNNASQRHHENHCIVASQKRSETQQESASQQIPETHAFGASQTESETHGCSASHIRDEAQSVFASPNSGETQGCSASQPETQDLFASQYCHETHCAVASQRRSETHHLSANHSRSKGAKDKGAIPETALKSKGTLRGDEPYGDSPRAQTMDFSGGE